MKKTMTRLLAILLILGCFLAMTACDEATESKEKTEFASEDNADGGEASKAPVAYTPPQGYTLYQKGAISFAYPDSWTLTDGSNPVMTGPSGNNINLVSEVATEENTKLYKSLSKQNFMEYIGNALVAMGMTVSNVEIGKETNDSGVEMIVCTYDATYVGKQMSFCQYIILGKDNHYTVTATECVSMADVVEELFKSIRVE